jgi:hypothetical protein
MTAEYEYPVQGGDDAVYGALVDATQRVENSDRRLWAVRVSVNASRFGADEAFSIRLKGPDGEGEIGKITIRPLDSTRSLMTVPKNRTGGANPPELDSDGDQFWRLFRSLLSRLDQLGLLPEVPQEKARLGYAAGGKECASRRSRG